MTREKFNESVQFAKPVLGHKEATPAVKLLALVLMGGETDPKELSRITGISTNYVYQLMCSAKYLANRMEKYMEK